MTFRAFESAISAEPLKRVARHWADVRGNRTTPEWNDIRPAALGAQLSIVWAWKYDPATDTFTGRLAGHAIEAIFDRSFRGTAMTDLFPPAVYGRIFARHKRVVTGPALFHGTGLVFRHLNRYGTGERIILPVTDGILGATVYEIMTGDVPEPVAAAGEREEWFTPD